MMFAIISTALGVLACNWDFACCPLSHSALEAVTGFPCLPKVKTKVQVWKSGVCSAGVAVVFCNSQAGEQKA